MHSLFNFGEYASKTFPDNIVLTSPKSAVSSTFYSPVTLNLWPQNMRQWYLSYNVPLMSAHKPTTELENRPHSVSITIKIIVQQCSSLADHLTTFHNLSDEGNDSRLRMVPQLIKRREGETDLSGSRVWWNSSYLRDIFVPPYKQCLTGSSWQPQQQQPVRWKSVISFQQGSHSSTDKKSRTFPGPPREIFQDLLGAHECLNVKNIPPPPDPSSLPLEVLGDLGECCELPQHGVRGLQPKSNLVQFSLQIWHLVATIFPGVSRTLNFSFQDFPGPKWFSRTFQVLEF